MNILRYEIAQDSETLIANHLTHSKSESLNHKMASGGSDLENHLCPTLTEKVFEPKFPYIRLGTFNDRYNKQQYHKMYFLKKQQEASEQERLKWFLA